MRIPDSENNVSIMSYVLLEVCQVKRNRARMQSDIVYESVCRYGGLERLENSYLVGLGLNKILSVAQLAHDHIELEGCG
jgi:hypothetical protein